MRKNIFKTYASCIPVKGAKRSVICDTQRGNYELIPNALYEILTEKKMYSFEELIIEYGEAKRVTLSGYFDFLTAHEFGFWTDTPELFPKLDLSWMHSSSITNAILDWDKNSEYDFGTIFSELNTLNCEHIELRFFDVFPFDKLENLIKKTDGKGFHSVSILLKFDTEISKEAYPFLLKQFPRIVQLIIHSSPENCVFEEVNKYYDRTSLVYTKQKIDSEMHCGIIEPAYFSVNISGFTESQKYNSCLNRKISIDRKGNIKNCPSMNTIFGNVKKESLAEVLARKEFKEVWFLHKDKINVCKDCEFRYICTDCRAYTVDDKPNEKPGKCMYDPYSAKWSNKDNLSLSRINEPCV